MRFIESKIDPSYSLTVLSRAEKDIIEALVEHPEVIRDCKKWAELSGRSTKAITRFKKLNAKMLAPAIQYATEKYFFEIWASLLRRARNDGDVKGKELLFKALRILKDEGPSSITNIFNIDARQQTATFMSESEINKLLALKGDTKNEQKQPEEDYFE